jgi:hypothetical protein
MFTHSYVAELSIPLSWKLCDEESNNLSHDDIEL